MAFSGGTFSRTFDCTTDRDNGVKILASKFDTELDGMATGLSTAILKDGTQTCTAAIPFAQGITLPDDKTIAFGTNSDVLIQYDETTTDSLKISAAEGAGLAITLMADEGDDAGDEWKLNIADGGTLTLGNDINSAGTYVTHLTITPNATVANSTMAVAGNLTVGGALTLGSGAVISEAELEAIDGVTAGTVAANKAVIVDSNKDAASFRNLTATGAVTGGSFVIGSADISEAELETIDGVTAGTVAASKAVVVDSNADITGFRNVTLTGELDAGSLDISGNADIDGTLETDALSINGTTVTSTAAELNILDGVTATAAELNILDGVTSTAAELNILDGVTSTASELNILDGVTSTAAELNILDGVTATATELNTLDGVTATATELNTLDGVTATSAELNYSDTGAAVGTVVASKVVTADANKDVSSFRNITLTGELDAGSLDISGNADIDGTLETDALSINGTAVTSTAAELNILDGVTSTAAELNILDGVTATASELNILDGVTSTAAELNILDGVTSTAAELNYNDTGAAVGTVVASKVVTADANKDVASFRNVTLTGELDAATLDISSNGEIDGTLGVAGGSTNGVAISQGAIAIKNGGAKSRVDFYCESGNAHYTRVEAAAHSAYSGNVTATLPTATGTIALTSEIPTTEQIQDIVGAMVSSNTETNVTVTYQDSDGTLDFVVDAELSDVTSLGTLTALDVDDINLNGKAMTMTGSTNDTAVFTAGTNGTLSIVTTDANAAAANIQITADGTAELAGTTVTLDSSGGITLDADGGTITFADAGSSLGTITSSGYSGTSATVNVADSTANTNFPVVFHDESNALLDDTGALRYNPSTGTLLVPNLSVAGTSTTVDTVTMQAENAIVFEGATADANETTLTIVDPTADRTINLPNQSGTIPVLAAASNTAITSTPAELNILDGATVVVGEINALDLGSTAVGNAIASKAVILDSNKDYTGIRNFTLSGELDAGSLDISGNADIDGTLETDALSINGTAVTSTAAELNILDGVTSTAAELNILDGVTTTAAEINLIDGGTARGTTAVADGDGVLINDAGTMRMTKVDTLSTYMAGKSVGGANIVTTGALNAGSITSGFGAINVGSSAITTSGTVNFGSISDGTITATAFVDEDDMSSDSATLIPTQQSVKAYVDANVASGAMTSFFLEDDDGTEVTIDNAKELKIIGAGVTTNFTDTSTGSDGDPFDLTITVDAAQTGITSVKNTSLAIGRDDDNLIKFGTDNQIIFEVSGGDNVIFKASGEIEASSLDISGDVDVDGTLETDAFSIAGTAVTSTAAELNILDGVTSTAAELNILDGVTSTAAELNALDGITAVVGELNALDLGSTAVGTAVASKAMILDSNKDYTGVRNFTLSGELDAGSLDVSGNADIDGTLEADAITVNGTALAEVISDTTGAMFSSNTETGISATYQDGDNTIDLAIAAAQTTITSLLATDIKIGEDDQTKIDFETADEIHFYAANVEQVYLGDNIFGPQSDSDVDLGSNSVRWKDAFVDSATVTGDVAVGDDITVAGRAVGTMTTDNDGSFDLAVSNDFKCTPSGNFTLTFTNGDVGQSGNIILINSGGHTVAAHADIAINADTLTALSTAGTYHLAYFCSADSGTNNTITVAATGALT